MDEEILDSPEAIRRRLRDIAAGRWSHNNPIREEWLRSGAPQWSAEAAIATADAAEAVKLEAVLRSMESEPITLTVEQTNDGVELGFVLDTGLTDEREIEAYGDRLLTDAQLAMRRWSAFGRAYPGYRSPLTRYSDIADDAESDDTEGPQ